MIVDNVVREHVETAAFQWAQWQSLNDEDPVDQTAANWVAKRLGGHLDGIRIAQHHAWPFVVEAFETYPERGELFVSVFLALELQDSKRLEQAVSFARVAVDGPEGLNGAFAWQPPNLTSIYVKEWIAHNDPIKVGAALAALIAHKYDPGDIFTDLLMHPSSKIRADSCQLAAVCGRHDLGDRLLVLIQDPQNEVRLAASLALGSFGRKEGVEILKDSVQKMGENWTKTLRSLVTNAGQDDLNDWLAQLYRSVETRKIPIRAAGMIGNESYDKWLIRQMADPELADHAGRAFLELHPTAWDEDLFSLEAGDFGADFENVLSETSDPLPVANRFRAWLEQKDV